MALHELVPNSIWYAQQSLHFGPIKIQTRMTVIRLRDGALWVHSPIEPTPSLLAELSSLGEVRYVLAPNRTHHLFFRRFLKSFPQARGFVAPGLAEKVNDLSQYPVVPTPEPWQDELQSWFIDGLPVLSETVWFHEYTGTLLLTDLLFCFGTNNTGLATLVARLLGVYDRLGMSLTMKLMTKDKQALRRSIEPLLLLPVQRIVLAHDQIIEEQPTIRLREAFEWLR